MQLCSNINLPILLVVAILCLQEYSAQLEDTHLEQCKKKFLLQAKTINFSDLPDCFNATKLEEAKNSTKILGQLVEGFPQECKPGNIKNISDLSNCFQHSVSHFRNHTAEIQTGITGGITALLDGSKACIDKAVQQVSGMDEYIAKGCPDEA